LIDIFLNDALIEVYIRQNTNCKVNLHEAISDAHERAYTLHITTNEARVDTDGPDADGPLVVILFGLSFVLGVALCPRDYIYTVI
jgi:hypothetical protein